MTSTMKASVGTRSKDYMEMPGHKKKQVGQRTSFATEQGYLAC